MLGLSIKTTSLCNLRCKHCSVIPWMDAVPNWHTSLDEIKRLIEACKDITFTHIFLSGGEPLLWKNIVEGSRLIKQSGITGSLVLFTNGMGISDPDKLKEIRKNVDVFRVAKYTRNSEAIERIKEVIKDVVIVDRTKHTVSPNKPVPNSLPAKCVCSAYSMVQGMIEICGPARTIIHRLDWEFDDPELSVPIESGFLEKLKKVDKFNKEWCKYCIANEKVARVQPKE